MDLQEIDDLIRAGQPIKARALIRAVPRKKLKRSESLRLAQLSRRAELPDLALELLNPLVRPTKPGAAKATPDELAEYGAALIAIGASEEAMGILGAEALRNLPQAVLFQGFARFSRWDYRGAVPVLKRYTEFPLAPYPRLVGLVNLAAALVATQSGEEARAVFKEIRALSRELGAIRLLGNALELEAQLAVLENRIADGSRLIDEALGVLSESGTTDLLKARKWRAILGLKRGGSERAPGIRELKAVRKESLGHGDWETVRDCDFHLLSANPTELQAARLYFGTPYDVYRERIAARLGPRWSPPETYRWVFREGAHPWVLKLSDGTVGERGQVLDPGSLPFRLVHAICRDLYRPPRVGELFGQVFRGEYYDPASSPHRVHQLILRTRRILLAGRSPLRIRHLRASSSFALEAEHPAAVELSLTKAPESRLHDRISRLLERWKGESIRSEDAARIFAVPERTARRMLKSAVELGLLSREGKARAIRYRRKS